MRKAKSLPARPITKKDFWACMSMTALFFFIVGGLTSEALSTYQTKHLENANYDRQSQSKVNKP